MYLYTEILVESDEVGESVFKSVVELPNNTDLQKYLDDKAKNYYEDQEPDTTTLPGKYIFEEGIVSIGRGTRFVTEEEFKILSKFL